MALFAEFVGGFYQALAPYEGADQAVNLFVETRQVPGSAKQITLYGVPGRLPEATLATTGCRGWFSQDGIVLVTVGDVVYQRTAAGTYASLGTILDDGAPVSYASNGLGGDQIGIVGGGQLKVIDTTTMTLSAAIALPFANPVMIAFQDGYGLINEADTPTVWFSALEDFTSWDALDFFARSVSSDNLIAIASTRDRVWVLGSETTTQYYDSGDVDTPWVPYPGTTVQVGIVTPRSLSIHADHLRFIGHRAAEGAQVFEATTGGEPQVISTPPIAQFLRACVTLDNAEVLAVERNGHLFTIWTCPSSPAAIQSYGYDAREQIWSAWAGWNSTTGSYTRWGGRGATVADQTTLVGDATTGVVSTLNLDTYTDNGAVLMRERIAPYLGARPQWSFVSQVQLLAQAGVGLSGTGQGSAPTAELLVSRDGAKTWISAGAATLGALGTYLARTIWRRVGRVRQDLLVLRVRQSDPVQTAWTGLDVTFTPGTGQL